jgi:hypothetical protein
MNSGIISGMNSTGKENRVSYPLPGPGLMISLSSSGWIGLLSLIVFGSDVGFAFVGITLATLIIKYSLIIGLGRYTLATGKDIFVGISQIPGPKNWAVWMINIISYFEVFMLGYSMLAMARLINELGEVQIPPVLVLCVLFLLIFILVAINSYWFFRKILISAITVIIICLCWIVNSMTIPIDEIIQGMIPNLVTLASIQDSAIILSSVGSGLSLLFYSVWLINHLKGVVPSDQKEQIFTRVKLDAGLGMGFLFFFCILYFSIGYLFLYEHGLGAPESDLTLEIILLITHLGIFGNALFVIVCLIALFCSLFGGIYGRARVLQVTLPRLVPRLQMSKKAYISIVACLILSGFSSQFFWSQEYTRLFISVRLLLFALIIVILILVDWNLQKEERGPKYWYGCMILGCVSSLYIGGMLMKELWI